MLTFALFVCGKVDQKKYSLVGKSTKEYKNEYNSKGKLEKISYNGVKENFFDRERNEEWNERFYSYDNRDSLRLIKGFTIYPNKGTREYSYEAIYTDSSITEITYNKYPTDTISYNRSVRSIGKEEEKVYPIISNDTVTNIFKGDTTIHVNRRKWTKYSSNDTIIIDTYDENNKQLQYKTKEYISKDVSITIRQDFEKQITDSTFYVANKKTKYIRVFPNKKSEYIYEYDGYGNIIKSVQSLYMTKEGIKEQQNSWLSVNHLLF